MSTAPATDGTGPTASPSADPAAASAADASAAASAADGTAAPAAAAPTAAAPTAAARRGLLHGVLWLSWRQHRTAVLTGAVLLVAAAAVAVYQRTGATAYVRDHHLAGCGPFDQVGRCRDGQDALFSLRDTFGNTLAYATGAAALLGPALIGMFLGAPLVGRELENGTHRLAWAQSVSPTRWFAAKLAVPAAAVALGGILLAVLLRWWWLPFSDRLSGRYWYSATTFPAIGPALVGHWLLALAVGTLAGLLLRRTFPAMAVSLAGTGALMYGLLELRPHLVPVLTRTAHQIDSTPTIPDTWWPVSRGWLTDAGQKLAEDVCTSAPDYESYEACETRHHITGQWIDYVRPDRFWTLQAAETGICLVLAATVTGAAFWWLRRRTG